MHQRMHVPFARIYIPLSPKKNETLAWGGGGGGGGKITNFPGRWAPLYL